ncbi:MAG: acyl-ACP thioesterase [Pseudorhodoferax sp.]
MTMHAMAPDGTGYVSHTTRVDAWECDHNGHWNTRFYMRAFQNAAETVALLDGNGNPGAATIHARHVRFHRELLRGDPVRVRSAAIQGGRWDGAIVHLLESDGSLSATALDLPGPAGRHVPQWPEEAVASALPRGLVHDVPDAHHARQARQARPDGRSANLGILRPDAYDHTGALMFDELFRYIGYAAHDHHTALGYSPRFTAQTGLGRMAVEVRTTLLGQAPAGMAIRSHSWLLQAQDKSFSSAHYLDTLQGDPIAMVEMCLLSVDMNSRRATQVPDFLRTAAGHASSSMPAVA